jgi:hypothetical protein
MRAIVAVMPRSVPALPLVSGVLIAGAAAWIVVRADASQSPSVLAEGLLGAVALICAWRWRIGIYAVLIYLTVEGLVTNTLYPRTTPLLFKDALLAATYLGFLFRVWRREERWPATVVVWPLLALGGLCAAEALNPSGVPLQVALIGMRVLLFYTPLYVLGMVLARDVAIVPRMVRLVLYTSIPVTLFGIWEWQRGPNAVAALGAGFARSIWVIGGESMPQWIFRPTSTFTFVGHYGAYLLFVGILAFAVLHLPLGVRERLLLVGVFGTAMVAMVVEAQRTSWVLFPMAVIGLYLLHRDRGGMLRGLPVLAAGVGLAVLVGGSVLSNRLPLLTMGLDVYRDRLAGTTGGAFAHANLLSLDALIGHGTGTALGAIRYVTGGSIPSAFESGWFIPFYMFGILGLLVYGWLYSAVLKETWQGCRAMPSAERWLGLAVLCFLFLTAAVNGPITSPPSNVYFWLFAGLVAGRRDTLHTALGTQVRGEATEHAVGTQVRGGASELAVGTQVRGEASELEQFGPAGREGKTRVGVTRAG